MTLFQAMAASAGRRLDCEAKLGSLKLRRCVVPGGRGRNVEIESLPQIMGTYSMAFFVIVLQFWREVRGVEAQL